MTSYLGYLLLREGHVADSCGNAESFTLLLSRLKHHQLGRPLTEAEVADIRSASERYGIPISKRVELKLSPP